MKAKELIAILEKYNGETEVVLETEEILSDIKEVISYKQEEGNEVLIIVPAIEE